MMQYVDDYVLQIVSTCCVLKSAVEAAAAIWAGDGKLISKTSFRTVVVLRMTWRMAMALAASFRWIWLWSNETEASLFKQDHWYIDWFSQSGTRT